MVCLRGEIKAARKTPIFTRERTLFIGNKKSAQRFLVERFPKSGTSRPKSRDIPATPSKTTENLVGISAPEKKYLAPPPPPNHPLDPLAPPPPLLLGEPPPPGIFNKKPISPPSLSPRLPFPSPEQKKKKNIRTVHQEKATCIEFLYGISPTSGPPKNFMFRRFSVPAFKPLLNRAGFGFPLLLESRGFLRACFEEPSLRISPLKPLSFLQPLQDRPSNYWLARPLCLGVLLYKYWRISLRMIFLEDFSGYFLPPKQKRGEQIWRLNP